MVVAELAKDNARLWQGMAWQGRPDVVLHLVSEAARKPVIEERRRNIPRSADLERDKVGLARLLMSKDLHRVVPNSEDNANQKATKALSQNDKDDQLEKGRDEGEEVEVRDVVRGEAGELQCVHGVGSDERVARQELVEDGLNDPRRARHTEDGEIEQGLVLEKELGKRLDVITLNEFLTPPQYGHCLDVWVTARGTVCDVGNGVVVVVLVLPPSDGETLPDVADHDAEHVVDSPVLKDLMVQKVVGEPAALLPEQAEQECRQQKRTPLPGVGGENSDTGGEDGKVA